MRASLLAHLRSHISTASVSRLDGCFGEAAALVKQATTYLAFGKSGTPTSEQGEFDCHHLYPQPVPIDQNPEWSSAFRLLLAALHATLC